MRCEICGEGSEESGLPDFLCWDGRAQPAQVHDWVRRLENDPYDRAGGLLGDIGTPLAAGALRNHLTSDSARVLQLVIRSLGWSGDDSDGPALVGFLDHHDEDVRIAAMESLTDLRVAEAIDPMFDRLDEAELMARERGRLIECLAWMRDRRVVPLLQARMRESGLRARVGKSEVARSLALVGDTEDRAEMARLAIARLEQSAADGYIEPAYARAADWMCWVAATEAVAPDEVAAVTAGLSEAALRATTYYPWVPPTPGEEKPDGSRGRAMAGFTPVPPAPSEQPAGKFFGQPDWRERPAWPIGGDGRLLMFYGQLPLGDSHTAYLFCAGPEEYAPLGPGSALIIQPGGGCHLPTVERSTGPCSHDWVTEPDHFVSRSRRLPQTERYIVWDDEYDPDTFEGKRIKFPDDSRVGGAPSWLQSDETPAGGWSFAFQFVADVAGSERADGAEFYGWTNQAGEGALGWACH
jgi:hypothetical protein